MANTIDSKQFLEVRADFDDELIKLGYIGPCQVSEEDLLTMVVKLQRQVTKLEGYISDIDFRTTGDDYFD